MSRREDHLVERMAERYGRTHASLVTVHRHERLIRGAESLYVGMQDGPGRMILLLKDCGVRWWIAWSDRLEHIETYLTEEQARVWERRASPLYMQPWSNAGRYTRAQPLQTASCSRST